jgi:hypothetical protein
VGRVAGEEAAAVRGSNELSIVRGDLAMPYEQTHEWIPLDS